MKYKHSFWCDGVRLEMEIQKQIIDYVLIWKIACGEYTLTQAIVLALALRMSLARLVVSYSVHVETHRCVCSDDFFPSFIFCFVFLVFVFHLFRSFFSCLFYSTDTPSHIAYDRKIVWSESFRNGFPLSWNEIANIQGNSDVIPLILWIFLFASVDGSAALDPFNQAEAIREIYQTRIKRRGWMKATVRTKRNEDIIIKLIQRYQMIARWIIDNVKI